MPFLSKEDRRLLTDKFASLRRKLKFDSTKSLSMVWSRYLLLRYVIVIETQFNCRLTIDLILVLGEHGGACGVMQKTFTRKSL